MLELSETHFQYAFALFCRKLLLLKKWTGYIQVRVAVDPVTYIMNLIINYLIKFATKAVYHKL
jgi:hypothetical protein